MSVAVEQQRAVLRRHRWLALKGKPFDESEHPRDEQGRFTDSGGDATGPSTPSPAARSHGIKGLPKDIVVKDPLISQAAERGAWDMTAKEREKGQFESGAPKYTVTITAKIPPGIKSFVGRPGRDRPDEYYDPKLAELFTENKGEQYIERTYARPLPGLEQEIAPLSDSDVIYRGMRAEEYEKYLKTGKIESTGAYNLEGQEGLTYWATTPSTAEHYANGFAPWPHKATFEKPAYVVATKMPKETRRVPGTGENEVGVARAIDKSEIIAVWRGDVFWHIPGDQDLLPEGYATDETTYTAGSGSAPSSSLVWQRLDADKKKTAIELQRATLRRHRWLALRGTFDESQHPRDEHGRWTDAGGGDGGGSGGLTPKDTSEYELPRTNYSLPFTDERVKDKFESEAEYKAVGGAIRDYKHASGDGDAYSVNRMLRGKQAMTPRNQQAVDHLDLAFKRTAAPIIDYDSQQPKDAWLYRGLSGRDAFDLKVGDVFRDDGFISTTIHESFAREWADEKGPGGTVMKIAVPKSTKVIGLLDIGRQEDETLLNRGTTFRVTKLSGSTIEVAVLP